MRIIGDEPGSRLQRERGSLHIAGSCVGIGHSCAASAPS